MIQRFVLAANQTLTGLSSFDNSVDWTINTTPTGTAAGRAAWLSCTCKTATTHQPLSPGQVSPSPPQSSPSGSSAGSTAVRTDPNGSSTEPRPRWSCSAKHPAWLPCRGPVTASCGEPASPSGAAASSPHGPGRCPRLTAGAVDTNRTYWHLPDIECKARPEVGGAFRRCRRLLSRGALMISAVPLRECVDCEHCACEPPRTSTRPRALSHGLAPGWLRQPADDRPRPLDARVAEWVEALICWPAGGYGRATILDHPRSEAR